jgi:isoleucyl-tRNA synthetase
VQTQVTAGTDTGYEALPAHVDLPALDHDVIAQWERGDVFRRSLKANEGGPIWMFYEGPPTANGRPAPTTSRPGCSRTSSPATRP